MKRYTNRIILAVWWLYWFGAGCASVHEQIKLRTEPETYGWAVAIGIIAIVTITIAIGFLAGVEYKSEQHSERRRREATEGESE